MIKPIIDTILGWTVSKKLSVWIVGTIMAFSLGEVPDNWLILSGIYMGVQGINDIWLSVIKAKAAAAAAMQFPDPLKDVD